VHGSVLPAVLELQAFFRAHGLPVIYALSGLALPEGQELAPWSWRAARLRQPGASIPLLLPPGAPEREPWPALAPRPEELLFYKQTLSPFNGTPLDQCLRNMRIENVVVVGVLTNAAADTTARDAGDRGFNAILVDDGCAALSPEDHEAGTAFPNWYVVKSKRAVIEELGSLVGLEARA
jgi:nicotinamidase-related amidase